MKLLLSLLLVVAICAGIYAWLNPSFYQQLRELSGQAGIEIPSFEQEVTTVYKWRDAQGHWQVTDRPPADGTPYETQRYHRDQNILPLPPQLAPKE